MKDQIPTEDIVFINRFRLAGYVKKTKESIFLKYTDWHH